MDKNEAYSALSEIKKLMERSTKILSLSGISSFFVGILSCISFGFVYWLCWDSTGSVLDINLKQEFWNVVIIAVVLIFLSIATVVLMSWRKAKKLNYSFVLDGVTKRLIWNFALPLVVGGILCIALIMQQHYGLISSVMLIFYGLALISMSNYTYSNTKYLGYAELLLGICVCFMLEYAFIAWLIGFGFFHIIYGIYFYTTLERNQIKQS